MYQLFSKVWDSSTTHYDLLLLTLRTKPSQSYLLPSVNRKLPQQDSRITKIFHTRCCPESSSDLYSTKQRRHPLSWNSIWCQGSYTMNSCFGSIQSHGESNIRFSGRSPSSFLHPCQTWRILNSKTAIGRILIYIQRVPYNLLCFSVFAVLNSL